MIAPRFDTTVVILIYYNEATIAAVVANVMREWQDSRRPPRRLSSC